MLKISIITPSFNQGDYIQDTIESVLDQNYENWEHIIVDGGSTDQTISILKKYPHLKWVSEKDNGSVHALNKGVKMSTGDIIGWLNSDDYYEKNIFQDVVNAFDNMKNNFVCGNQNFCSKDKKVLLTDKTIKIDKEYIVKKNPYVIRTPSAFYSKYILEKVNFFNESYKIVFDYDMFVKILSIDHITLVDKVFANYRFHEKTLSLNNVRKQVNEIFKISTENGRKFFDPITFLLYRTLIKNFLGMKT